MHLSSHIVLKKKKMALLQINMHAMVFVSKTPSKKFHSNLKKWKACPPPLDSLSLFPLFTLPFPVLWNFIFIFFYLYVFIFLVFNLLIGAKTEVVNCALSKKSEYSLFCHSHFIKEKRKRKKKEKKEPVCSKVCTMETSWKWDFTSLLLSCKHNNTSDEL